MPSYSPPDILSLGRVSFSDGMTVFADKLHASKEAISGALRRGFGELDIVSYSRHLTRLCHVTEQFPRFEGIAWLQVKVLPLMCTRSKLTSVMPKMSTQTCWLKLLLIVPQSTSRFFSLAVRSKGRSLVTRWQHGNVDGISWVMPVIYEIFPRPCLLALSDSRLISTGIKF